MSDITDVVKALTELSSALRVKAAGRTARDYDRDVELAYHDAADRVDALTVGPAIQVCLDQMDVALMVTFDQAGNYQVRTDKSPAEVVGALRMLADEIETVGEG